MALVQTRPYRDFLTPSLHRRFTNASFYTLALCYGIAIWMGGIKDFFWSWFPIGPAGLRTLLLFIPAITVYILRVAQWHVGSRNTMTPAETFTSYALRKTTFSTAAFYSVSAWFYCEVYIWTRPSGAKLDVTNPGAYHERIKLNERPVYLRFMFIALAVVQAGIHLCKDYDNIKLPALLPQKDRDGTAQAPPRKNIKIELVRMIPSMAKNAGILTLCTFVTGTSVYFLGLRYIVWEYHYWICKNLFSLSKVTRPTGVSPFAPLVIMFVMEGTFLALLWTFVNNAFDLYITQEPLKKGKPITSDSKDPNGSLLNGLKSKKEAVKAIAFWELAIITERFPERRKTIFGELDRKKAPTFKQVADLCLSEVAMLIERLNVGIDPSYRPKDEADKKAPTGPINLVPQIAQPLKTDIIAGPGARPETRLEKFGEFTADIAKTRSSPQNAQNAIAKKYIAKGQEKLNQGAQEAGTAVNTWSSKIIASPIGWPFRASLRRTASLVVTGAPYSKISILCNAITTLANLASVSVKEDAYGSFHVEVPEIIRKFTLAIKKLEEYIDKVEIHWSDMETLTKPEAERKKVAEVEHVRRCLKLGQERILGAFNEYLSGMGLSRLEIQEAKQSVSSRQKPEMAESGR